MRSTYIAGRYSRREELAKYAQELRGHGVKVTASWLNETLDPNVQMKDVTVKEMEEIAEVDLKDIDRADSFVFFAEDQNKQPPRGGRHVEFGYALAFKKDIHVIGDAENIFHHLPWVKVHPSWTSFVETMAPRVAVGGF